MIIQTINPSTEKILGQYFTLDEKKANICAEKSHKAFLKWRKIPLQERRQCVNNLASILRQRCNELAILMASEMGKPVQQGRREVEKCADLCNFFAENAEHFLQPHHIKTAYTKAMVHYLPLGVVFSIQPWNYPCSQIIRNAIPNVMVGNTILLKHAPICTGMGNRMAELFLEAAFPEDVFQHLVLDNEGADKLIACPHIVGVAFTGSAQTGRIIAATAGANLKKVVLELGGNDPYVVLDDADLDVAANTIVHSRLTNAGQVCIAAKRAICVKQHMEALQDKILQIMSEYTFGNPLDDNTNLGPMARADLREKLHQQVQASIQEGATLVTGGTIPKQQGFYYPATLLTHVTPEMTAFKEELFGPVVVLTDAANEQDAIKKANHSSYGLGAAVFTQNIQRGEQIAVNDIESGICWVNDMVRSDIRLPFGGVKGSGFGKEYGREGMLEFVNTKTVVVK